MIKSIPANDAALAKSALNGNLKGIWDSQADTNQF